MVTKIIPTATCLLFGNESIQLNTKFMEDYTVGFKEVDSECCMYFKLVHWVCELSSSENLCCMPTAEENPLTKICLLSENDLSFHELPVQTTNPSTNQCSQLCRGQTSNN